MFVVLQLLTGAEKSFFELGGINLAAVKNNQWSLRTKPSLLMKFCSEKGLAGSRRPGKQDGCIAFDQFVKLLDDPLHFGRIGDNFFVGRGQCMLFEGFS